MNNRAIKIRAALAVGLLGLAGCGGGGGGGGGGGVGIGVPVNVNSFDFASNIVNGGPLDASEPRDIDNVVLSTTDSDEPDPRV